MTVVAYVLYLALSIGITVWVGRTLFRAGRSFLERVFAKDGDLADSVNRLLLTGFYLVNVGFIALHLKAYGEIDDTRAAIELLSVKVGVVVLVLGAMHFFNLYVLSRIWRGRKIVEDDAPRPTPLSRPPRYVEASSVVPGSVVVPALDGAAVASRG